MPGISSLTRQDAQKMTAAEFGQALVDAKAEARRCDRNAFLYLVGAFACGALGVTAFTLFAPAVLAACVGMGGLLGGMGCLFSAASYDAGITIRNNDVKLLESMAGRHAGYIPPPAKPAKPLTSNFGAAIKKGAGQSFQVKSPLRLRKPSAPGA